MSRPVFRYDSDHNELDSTYYNAIDYTDYYRAITTIAVIISIIAVIIWLSYPLFAPGAILILSIYTYLLLDVLFFVTSYIGVSEDALIIYKGALHVIKYVIPRDRIKHIHVTYPILSVFLLGGAPGRPLFVDVVDADGREKSFVLWAKDYHWFREVVKERLKIELFYMEEFFSFRLVV